MTKGVARERARGIPSGCVISLSDEKSVVFRIFVKLRTPVSLSRNQCPPIMSILETFCFEDGFQ